MIRRMLLLSLFATVPALVCAQEAKLINCRSLDAAGNFVGPDEIVVDDLVCQKVKSGATAAAAPKPEPPKPLPGAVISDEEPPSVVDAAKASAKRVAAAVQANAGKSTAPSDSARRKCSSRASACTSWGRFQAATRQSQQSGQSRTNRAGYCSGGGACGVGPHESRTCSCRASACTS